MNDTHCVALRLHDSRYHFYCFPAYMHVVVKMANTNWPAGLVRGVTIIYTLQQIQSGRKHYLKPSNSAMENRITVAEPTQAAEKVP